ncbi:MAG: metal-dependent hydrolase [Haloplanus sp.]
MYRRGHWGVALLVFAPLGFALSSLGRTDLALAGGAVMLWLAMLPDYDVRVPGLSHRGPTHTLAFALVVGAVGAGAGGGLAVAADRPHATVVGLALFGFAIATLAVLAHLLADALTPSGVPFLWPLSGRRYSLHVVRADNALANLGLLALGVSATVAAAVVAVNVV